MDFHRVPAIHTLVKCLHCQEKHELIKMITSEEISEFVDRLVLDTVYFLEEEEHE